MPQLSTTSSAFDEDVASYRPMSRIAVTSAVIGVASVLALLHPVLWCLPAVGFVLGLIALRQLKAAAGQLTGRWIAVMGICLSVFFASWVVSSYYLSDYLVARQSRRAADRWLQMIEKHALRHAHQWTLSYVNRANPGEPLDEYYKPQGDQESGFKRFFGKQPAKALSEMNEGDQFAYIGCEDLVHDRLNCYVTLRYQLTYAAGDPPLEFLIVMRRFKDPETYAKSWTVLAVAPSDAETEP